MEQARRSLNQTEREKLYGEVQDILAKEMVWIPVYTTKEIIATRAGVKGFTIHPVEYNLLAVEDLARQVAARVGRRRMLTFVVRRLLLAVPVLLGVVFVVMLTVELMPGDAVALMLGEHATPEAVAKLRDYLGLDKPFARPLRGVRRPGGARRPRALHPAEPAGGRRAGRRLAGHARADGGRAGHRRRRRASRAGVVSAVWPNSFFDAVARLGSLFGLSMPVFWTGLVLIVVFSLWLHLAARWAGAGSLAHLVLPAVTLALPSVAMVARMTRSSVLDVLREDYVRTARAKGVAERLWCSASTRCATRPSPS